MLTSKVCKHNQSCISFHYIYSGTAENTLLNSINYPFLTFSSLAALFQNGIPTWLPHWPTCRNTVDILQIGIGIHKYGNTIFFHFSSQTIQPCMFHYQMIKRPLVNIYIYVKHTNELGRIFKTTLTIFPDIASPF